MTYFVEGLKVIARMLINSKTSLDDLAGSKSIFDFIEFIVAADELFESSDLTAEQYVKLIAAIFGEDPDVENLFDLHRCPEFLEACDSDDVRQSLVLRDLLHLGKMLTPIEPISYSDDHLKFAIHTGIHNFRSSLGSDLPQDFVNIIYHMFSSGDNMILEACQTFLETDDSDVVEDMLFREYKIFCSNQQRRSIENEYYDAKKEDKNEKEDGHALTKFSPDLNFAFKPVCPEVFLTAVAALVDLEDICEESAVAIIASYQNGNILLREVYQNFIECGDAEEFLNMVNFEWHPMICLYAYFNLTQQYIFSIYHVRNIIFSSE